MLGFSFTEKKFFAFNQQTQNKHLAIWLKNCYQKSQEKEISLEVKKLLFQRYLKLYLKQNLLIQPQSSKEWLEFFSQRYHYHYKIANPAKEAPLLKGIPLKEQRAKKKIKASWGVVLHNIRSAFNVGSILRTIDAAGWEKAIFSGYTADVNNKNLQKSAMHTQQWVSHERVDNIANWLQQQKIPIIALETTKKAKNCFSYNWTSQGILLLGNEEYGIPNALIKKCEQVVQIPMWGKKSSLNVANAFSIIAYLVTQKLL